MKIITEIASLIGASAFSKALTLIKGVIVAKFLTPEMFGLIDIVYRIRDLAKYGEFGFTSVVVNEYNFLKGTDEKKELKDAGFSGDIFVAIVLSTAVMFSSFFFHDNTVVFWGLMANAFQLLFIKIINLYKINFRIAIQFVKLSKFTAFYSILYNTAIIVTVPYLNVYSPLILPVFVEILMILILRNNEKLNFVLKFDFKSFFRLFRKGIVLSGLTMMTGLSIYFERFIILKLFDLKILGYFALVFFSLNVMKQFIADMAKPYMPRVKKKLGDGDMSILKPYVIKPTVIALGIAIAVIAASYFIVPFLIVNYFSKYTQSIELFKIMLPLIYVFASTAFSGYLLYSPGINKTKFAYLSHFVYIVCLVLFSYFLYSIDNHMIIVAYSMLISAMVRASIQNTVIFNIIFNSRLRTLGMVAVLNIFPVAYLILANNLYEQIIL